MCKPRACRRKVSSSAKVRRVCSAVVPKAWPAPRTAHHWHAGALAALGRHDQAIAAAERAVELDPLSLSVHSDLGWYHLFADRWQEAADSCRDTLAMSAGYGWAEACLSEALLQLGDHRQVAERALDELCREGRLGSGDGQLDDAILDGLPPPSAFRAIVRYRLSLELSKGDADADPFRRAVFYGRLGEVDEAVRWLERSFDRHDPWLVFLRVDPRLDPLHGHPRFEALAAELRIGDGSAEARGYSSSDQSISAQSTSRSRLSP